MTEGGRYFPIAALNTTTPPWWVVKARVVDVSSMSHIKGGKSLFHADIIDNKGDVIRAKFWGAAAEKWRGSIIAGKVFSFAKGRIFVANKKFSTIPHNYELSFETDSKIESVKDEGEIDTHRKYVFTSLRDIRSTCRSLPFQTDICGVLHSVEPCIEVNTKDGRKISKRTIKLVDDTDPVEFEIAVWGNSAEQDESAFPINSAVAISGVQIREYNSERQGAWGKDSVLRSNLKDPRVAELNHWFPNGGSEIAFRSARSMAGGATSGPTSTSFEYYPLEAIQDIEEGGAVTVASVRRVMWRSKETADPDRLMYAACPKCKKKLHGDGDQLYCVHCGSESETVAPMWNYMILVRLIDCTGSVVVRLFSEAATALMGMKASSFRQLTAKEKERVLDHDLVFKPLKLALRIKTDSYNGETRSSLMALKCTPTDYRSLSKFLLERLKMKYDIKVDDYSSKRSVTKDVKEELSTDQRVKKEKLIQGVV